MIIHKTMNFEIFLKKHPLFHHRELVAYMQDTGHFSPNTLKASLQYHLSKKHLVRIRRGYYLVSNSYLPSVPVEDDYLLIAGRMASDAVLSYHTAMEFHALAYSVGSILYFNSNDRIGHLTCASGQYQQLFHPKTLIPNKIYMETMLHDRMGMDIRVTSIERTLVDSLHRPELSGGWEEIWRSFESINFLDIDRVIKYALQLCNATTIAKLGFFLEQHHKQFSVTEKQLNHLEKYRPKSRHYMERGYKGANKNMPRWNLIVPMTVMNKSWEEPDYDNF